MSRCSHGRCVRLTDASAGCAVTGQSLIYGTGMGLATLSSQAFGAKNYRRVGVLWQRQCVYQWLLCIVVALVPVE